MRCVWSVERLKCFRERSCPLFWARFVDVSWCFHFRQKFHDFAPAWWFVSICFPHVRLIESFCEREGSFDLIGAIPVSPKITNNHFPDFFGNKRSQQKQKLTTHRNTKKHHHDFLLHRFWASVFHSKNRNRMVKPPWSSNTVANRRCIPLWSRPIQVATTRSWGLAFFFGSPWGFNPAVRLWFVRCFGKKKQRVKKKTKRAKGVFSNQGNQIELDL